MNRVTRLITWLLVVSLGGIMEVSGQESATRPATRPTTRPSAKPEPASHSSFVAGFAGAIESRHGHGQWAKREGLECRITVTFGGRKLLAGRLIMETMGARTRLELEDGSTVVFDGKQAWVSPASAEVPMARFHALTWSYFLAAPMKLRDPGSRLTPKGSLALDGKEYDAAKLSFEPGIGDAPDDWYICYKDPEQDELYAMAYVVTYGKSPEEAEADPHAITYEEYTRVEGVLIAKKWRFWHWSPEKGIHGDPIGESILSDIKFVVPSSAAFAKSEDAKLAPLPAEAEGNGG